MVSMQNQHSACLESNRKTVHVRMWAAAPVRSKLSWTCDMCPGLRRFAVARRKAPWQLAGLGPQGCRRFRPAAAVQLSRQAAATAAAKPEVPHRLQSWAATCSCPWPG